TQGGEAAEGQRRRLRGGDGGGGDVRADDARDRILAVGKSPEPGHEGNVPCVVSRPDGQRAEKVGNVERVQPVAGEVEGEGCRLAHPDPEAGLPTPFELFAGARTEVEAAERGGLDVVVEVGGAEEGEVSVRRGQGGAGDAVLGVVEREGGEEAP